MRIGVIGTGIVGRTVAGRLGELGHDVVIGTRDVAATRARGDDALDEWLSANDGVSLVSFDDAAKHGELVVNATSGAVSMAALEQAGGDGLGGKPLLDISNPLDFSKGFPPTLLVKDTDSLAEQIQRAFPGARVVKSLNTVNADVMVHPDRVGAGDHTMFVAGNDASAKQTVVGLLHEFGWRDVIDLGDLTAARGLEMVLPLWLRMLQTFGAPRFNFKIVR
jgi:8-hydroxy-5-deazaflavin:NADPH oxidoreductase